MITLITDSKSHARALARIQLLWDAPPGSEDERELDALATLVDTWRSQLNASRLARQKESQRPLDGNLSDVMSFNLIVWKWAPAYDSAAKRRKLGGKYENVTAAFADAGKHPAMAKHDFRAFEQAVFEHIGPEVTDGPYILERSTHARVFNLPFSQVDKLVPKLGMIARAHGLTSAEG
jgi:hypothetical protein